MKLPDNLVLVIFGASGDLTSRKLIPALFSLMVQKMLPLRFAVLGTGRTKLSDNGFREKMMNSIRTFAEDVNFTDEDINGFVKCLFYSESDNQDPGDFLRLKSRLCEIDSSFCRSSNYIFYMATPPEVCSTIAGNLARAGLTEQKEGFRRFIFEKPFGTNLETARELNSSLHNLMGEEQIYRIDHYLGKETVQNLLVTRFANGIFEPLWNRNYVHRIEITSAESLGIEGRGSYYNSSGALRDMVQNHLLQMVGLTAMEPPSSIEPDAIRNEILKVLQSIQPIREAEVQKQVIRGQYTGSVIRGEKIPGYREENDIPPLSRTETYVGLKFFINNWRWGGVPFYIRTGKRMPSKITEIVVYFKKSPHHLFQREDVLTTSNQFIIRIQPNEGILLKFDLKQPGAGFNVKNVNMDFHYKELAEMRLPSAYERLLYDVMMGDPTLFLRSDEVETSWKFIDPVLKAWAERPDIKIYGYPAGTWGPSNANDLIQGCGLSWRYPSKNLADDGIYCEL